MFTALWWVGGAVVYLALGFCTLIRYLFSEEESYYDAESATVDAATIVVVWPWLWLGGVIVRIKRLVSAILPQRAHAFGRLVVQMEKYIRSDWRLDTQPELALKLKVRTCQQIAIIVGWPLAVAVLVAASLALIRRCM